MGGGSTAAPTGGDSAKFRTGGAEAGRRGVCGGGQHLSPSKQVDTEGLVAGSDRLRSLTQRPLELITDPGAAPTASGGRKRPRSAGRGEVSDFCRAKKCHIPRATA